MVSANLDGRLRQDPAEAEAVPAAAAADGIQFGPSLCTCAALHRRDLSIFVRHAAPKHQCLTVSASGRHCYHRGRRELPDGRDLP